MKEFTQQRTANIVVLSTGGTISSRNDVTGAKRATDTAKQLALRLPWIEGVEVEYHDVMLKGSYQMTLADLRTIHTQVRSLLAQRPELDGIVVTHGTDTIEETAFLVDLFHDDPRPVVFTGAQLAADVSDTDGPRNLGAAIVTAAHHESRDRGVLVQFDHQLDAARGVRKVHTLDLHAFGSPDGPLGHVREGQVSFTRKPSRPAPLRQLDSDFDHNRVEIVPVYPGADPVLLEAAVDAGAKAIVLMCTGAGNANSQICEAVAKAVANGVVVGVSTRVFSGPVRAIYGNGGGTDLLSAGAVLMGALTPAQARILLAAVVSITRDRADITSLISTHI